MKSASRSRPGFTLIELLVVIGIILLLLAILLPVVSQVRTRAYQASTQAQMSRIMSACQSYYHDFNAYPGPIANRYLAGATTPGGEALVPILPTTPGTPITSSENLVLGLFGFLTPPTSATPTITFVAGPPTHDVLSLNPLHPTAYHYMDFVAEELDSQNVAGAAVQTGYSKDLEFAMGLGATDSEIPEFVDRFPDHAPILYVRANVGNTGMATGNDTTQYNYNTLASYGCNVRVAPSPGLPTSYPLLFDSTYFTSINGYATSPGLADNLATPFAAWTIPSTTVIDAYFQNPNIAFSVRGKDGFVLISAGVDRTYGTHDDIIVTP